MSKNTKVLTKEKFNTIKQFTDSGIASDTALARVVGYSSSMVNRIRHNSWEDYCAKKEAFNTIQKENRAKAKLEVFSLDEPVQEATAIGGQAMDDFVSEIENLYPSDEPALDNPNTLIYLARIADALERLADAWTKD